MVMIRRVNFHESQFIFFDVMMLPFLIRIMIYQIALTIKSNFKFTVINIFNYLTQ